MTTIRATKRLGIWMDHSSAHLMDLSGPSIQHKTITSGFTRDDKTETLEKSENVMHNKEQHKHTEFYKELGDNIRNYTEVILFGPTNAKSELHNLLKADHRFSDIRIEVKSADKMSDSDRHDFVIDYFKKHI